MSCGGARRSRRIFVTIGYAASLSAGITSVSQAQVGSIGGAGGASLQPPPVASGRPDVFARPGRADTALIVGDWLLYPSGFAGVVYDSNVNDSSTGVVSSPGLRLAPSLLAETDNGISKTSLYGTVDGRLYLDQRANGSDAISVRSGVVELYQPLPDLIVIGQGDFTRQKDIFSTLGVTNDLLLLNTTATGLAPTVNPQSYSQLSGRASVQKDFASAFTILSGSVVDQMYDSRPGAVASSSDGVVYTGTGRGGIWITPALYGYIEGALDTRDYVTRAFNSSGYRAVVGLGTDQIGLLKGEAYAGFQSESGQSGGIATNDGPLFGARIYYYPLPELTINLAANETLGVSLLATTPTSAVGALASIGTSTKVTSVLGTASYSIAPEWGASGRAGYIHTEYNGNPRRDDACTVGGTISYNFWRSVGLTLDYQHVQLTSNVAFQSFSRDVITFGATYKY